MEFGASGCRLLSNSLSELNSLTICPVIDCPIRNFSYVSRLEILGILESLHDDQHDHSVSKNLKYLKHLNHLPISLEMKGMRI